MTLLNISTEGTEAACPESPSGVLSTKCVAEIQTKLREESEDADFSIRSACANQSDLQGSREDLAEGIVRGGSQTVDFNEEAAYWDNLASSLGESRPAACAAQNNTSIPDSVNQGMQQTFQSLQGSSVPQ